MDGQTAVVIPTWDSREHLARCLASVQAQSGGAIELMVVDNGSSDGTRELLEGEAIPHATLERNIGFAAAINLGAVRTGAPFVLVLNVDTVLEPEAIERLTAALAADPSLGGVQPRIRQLGAGPPRIYSAGQRLARDGRAWEEGLGDLDGPRHQVPREIFGASGAAALLRRELFTRVGGYDESYFAFHEDVDLNARARILGWRFGYVPEAIVWHVGQAVWSTVPDRPMAFNARLMARNRLATGIKVMPARFAPWIALAEVGSLLLGVRQGRFLAKARGKLEVIRWLPRLLRERRALKAKGDPANLVAWMRPAGSRRRLHS